MNCSHRKFVLTNMFIYFLNNIGNVGYDPVSSRLVFTTDSPNGEASNSHDHLIPYIPYPVNPENGQPTKINFSVLERKSDMKMNGPMTDPETGQTVPILGMTIHPETGMKCLQHLQIKQKVLILVYFLCKSS